MIKKVYIVFILTLLILLSSDMTILADSYNYTPLETVIESAESMSVTKVIDNSNFLNQNNQRSTYQFGELKDVFVYEDKIFVSDATNNIIYELNTSYQLVDTFPKQDLDEEEQSYYNLNQPNGLYAFDDKLYVADTENQRIVVFDIYSKEIIMTISDPQDPTFDNRLFKPLKITVDRTGRMFVIALDVFEGIMDFNSDGSFSRFYGTNVVTMSFFEALIYRFSSEEQRQKQALKLQTSFTNLDIDEYGYVYTVSRPDNENTIKKINFKGQDVLNRNGYVNPVGDVVYLSENQGGLGASNLVDVAVSPNGLMYSVLDETRGRIFTYDNEGNLLYIYGELGDRSTMFSSPQSLAYYEDRVIVVDSLNHSIIVFEPTNFGDLINQAISYYSQAKYSEAKILWEEVLALNSNYFLAYNGIGKSQLREGDYQSAIKNLKLGNDNYNYSKAFENARNEKLDIYLPYMLGFGFVLIGYLFYKSMKNALQREGEEDE